MRFKILSYLHDGFTHNLQQFWTGTQDRGVIVLLSDVHFIDTFSFFSLETWNHRQITSSSSLTKQNSDNRDCPKWVMSCEQKLQANQETSELLTIPTKRSHWHGMNPLWWQTIDRSFITLFQCSVSTHCHFSKAIDFLQKFTYWFPYTKAR